MSFEVCRGLLPGFLTVNDTCSVDFRTFALSERTFDSYKVTPRAVRSHMHPGHHARHGGDSDDMINSSTASSVDDGLAHSLGCCRPPCLCEHVMAVRSYTPASTRELNAR